MTTSEDPHGAALTHLDEHGAARMVDVGEKSVTSRRAVAEGWIRCSREAFDAMLENRVPKGDVLAVARIGGIMGGKRAGELIPLCHMLPEAAIRVEVHPDAEMPGVRAIATATISGKTGVEMEALTAVALALLTVHDMIKAVDPATEIGGIRLMEKEGGRSGYVRPAPDNSGSA